MYVLVSLQNGPMISVPCHIFTLVYSPLTLYQGWSICSIKYDRGKVCHIQYEDMKD